MPTKQPKANGPATPSTTPPNLGGKPMSGTTSAPKAGSPMPTPRKIRTGNRYMKG